MKNRFIALGTLALLFAARSSYASYHVMKVNEVGLSKGGDATAQFIELRDDGSEPFPASPGSYDVAVYDENGVMLGSPIALDRENLAANQTAYLISTATANTKFTVTGNVALAITLPANGQACFRAAGAEVHCLAWGAVLAPKAGASTGASPTDGNSLQRQPNGTYSVLAATPKAANALAPLPDGGTPVVDSGTDAGNTGIDSGSPGTGSTQDSGTATGSDAGAEATPSGSSDDGGCNVGATPGAGAAVPLLFGVLMALRGRKKK
jgi:hypothetical protein